MRSPVARRHREAQQISELQRRLQREGQRVRDLEAENLRQKESLKRRVGQPRPCGRRRGGGARSSGRIGRRAGVWSHIECAPEFVGTRVSQLFERISCCPGVMFLSDLLLAPDWFGSGASTHSMSVVLNQAPSVVVARACPVARAPRVIAR